MNEKTTMRRVGWLDEAHPEKTEQWLADVAAEGWQLTGAGRWIARFARREPANLRFMCIPNRYRARSYAERQQFIDVYRHMGWQCVDELEYYLVFYAPMEAETPLGEENRILAGRLTAWRKRIISYFAGALVFAALIWLLIMINTQYALLQGSLATLALVVGAAIFIILGIKEYVGYRRKDRALDTRKRNFSTAVMSPLLSRLFPFALNLLICFSPLIGYAMERNVRQFPESLTVMRAADLSGGAAFANATPNDEAYSLAHSILFPDQILYFITVERPDGGAELYYQTYRALAPWLAGWLARDIARSTSVTFSNNDSGIPESTDTMGFDRLWRYDETGRHLLVAVKDSTVYQMSLTGDYTTDDMLRALLQKIS